MRFYRSELAFMAYLLLLVGAAACAFWASDIVFRQFPAAQDGALGGGILALRIALVLLSGAILIGLFYFYPMIRKQAREHGQLQQMTKSLTAKSATFQHAALTDPLTGLQNRRYFDDALAQYMDEFSRIERPLGIMIVDIDHFKSINDTHGHDVGDEVIKGLANTIIEYTRYHDIAARIGGEEFAVVAPNLTVNELDKLANRLRLAVSNLAFNVGNVRLRITISIGIAIWDGKESGAALYKRADSNLYNAKRSGRNRVCA
ncbi:GGDEF domain-containing protein [Oricola nitratireducens]|uniref:GGDEF domain-containing protein n=1 Tax=Oricola nitratireducens TaxID=2775868 RepID=UPI0018685B68|nr:GGDEF domain-containing protein [Oricola nitratireducens]